MTDREDEIKLTPVEEEGEDVLKTLEERYFGLPETADDETLGKEAPEQPGTAETGGDTDGGAEAEPPEETCEETAPSVKKKKRLLITLCSFFAVVIAAVVTVTVILGAKNKNSTGDNGNTSEDENGNGQDVPDYLVIASGSLQVKTGDDSSSALKKRPGSVTGVNLNSGRGQELTHHLNVGETICKIINKAISVNGPVKHYLDDTAEFTVTVIPDLLDPDAAFSGTEINVQPLHKETVALKGNYIAGDAGTDDRYTGTQEMIYENNSCYIGTVMLTEVGGKAVITSALVMYDRFLFEYEFSYSYYGKLTQAVIRKTDVLSSDTKDFETETVCLFSEGELYSVNSVRKGISLEYSYETEQSYEGQIRGYGLISWIETVNEETGTTVMRYDSEGNVSLYQYECYGQIIKEEIVPSGTYTCEYRSFMYSEEQKSCAQINYMIPVNVDVNGNRKLIPKETLQYDFSTGEGVFTIYDATGRIVFTGPAAYGNGNWTELSENEAASAYTDNNIIFRRITWTEPEPICRLYQNGSVFAPCEPEMTAILDLQNNTFCLYTTEVLPYIDNDARKCVLPVQVKYTGVISRRNGLDLILKSYTSEYVGVRDDAYDYFSNILTNDNVNMTNRFALEIEIGSEIADTTILKIINGQ